MAGLREKAGDRLPRSGVELSVDRDEMGRRAAVDRSGSTPSRTQQLHAEVGPPDTAPCEDQPTSLVTPTRAAGPGHSSNWGVTTSESENEPFHMTVRV